MAIIANGQNKYWSFSDRDKNGGTWTDYRLPQWRKIGIELFLPGLFRLPLSGQAVVAVDGASAMGITEVIRLPCRAFIEHLFHCIPAPSFK
jgi:hypothetical protein